MTNSSLRKLPFRLEPIEGEALWSYAIRLANRLECSVFNTLKFIGIPPKPRAVQISFLSLLHPTAPQMVNLAYATRLSVNIVKQMTLASYENEIMDATDVEKFEVSPRNLLSGTYWISSKISPMCPMCLKEDRGAWQLNWMIPWTFMCRRHEVFLQLNCLACNRILGPDLYRIKVQEAHHLALPTLSLYSDYLKCTPKSEWGIIRCTCAYELLTYSPVSTSGWSELTKLQSYLHEIMKGEPATFSGRNVSSVEYLRILKAICLVVMNTFDTESIVDLLTIHGMEIEESSFVNMEGIRLSRNQLVQQGSFMAVILCEAMKIMSLPNPEEFVVALANIYTISRRDSWGGTTRVEKFVMTYKLPETFVSAAYELKDQLLRERIKRDGGLYFGNTKNRIAPKLNAAKYKTRVKLKPVQVEALREQVRENEKLSLQEQADFFQIMHGIIVKPATMYQYITKLGYERQSVGSKRVWRKVNTQGRSVRRKAIPKHVKCRHCSSRKLLRNDAALEQHG